MSQLFASGLTVVLVVSVAGSAAGALSRLAEDAAESADAWREERAVRLCAAELAYALNLADAAVILAGENPRVAADVLALAPRPEPRVCGEGDDGPSAVVIQERNPDLPRGWPNWVTRVRGARGG